MQRIQYCSHSTLVYIYIYISVSKNIELIIKDGRRYTCMIVFRFYLFHYCYLHRNSNQCLGVQILCRADIGTHTHTHIYILPSRIACRYSMLRRVLPADVWTSAKLTTNENRYVISVYIVMAHKKIPGN